MVEENLERKRINCHQNTAFTVPSYLQLLDLYALSKEQF